MRRAVGLVVGTHNDANNLSIVMTARTLNPDLFIAVREHHKDNEELFRAVGANIVMHPSTIIADRIRILLVTPLLTEFEQLVRLQDHAWSCELVSRIVALVDHQVPDVWEVAFDDDNAHAICVLTGQGAEVTLGALLRDPRAREGSLPIIPLLLVQGGGQELLPSEDRQVGPGDRLLLCGRPLGRSRLGWTLQTSTPSTMSSRAAAPLRGPSGIGSRGGSNRPLVRGDKPCLGGAIETDVVDGSVTLLA